MNLPMNLRKYSTLPPMHTKTYSAVEDKLIQIIENCINKDIKHFYQNFTNEYGNNLNIFLHQFKFFVGEELTFDNRYGYKSTPFLFVRGCGISYWDESHDVMSKIQQFLFEKYPDVH